MSLTMYDTAFNDQFPSGAQAYAAYVDGSVGDQPNYSYIVRTFPGAQHLSIAVFAKDDADALDVEQFAAAPEDIAGWYTRQRARGIARPCIYASALTMESNVVPVIQALSGVAREEVRLWSAHYGAGEHICGPSSCGLVSIGMDGTQWTSSALGRTLDQSLLLDGFFGTAPPPPQYAEFDMAKIAVLRQGDIDQLGGGFWSVHRLQDLLSLTGRLNGIAAAQVITDGVFGPKTAAAVRAVEEHYRQLFPQMIVDPAGQETAGPQVWGVLLTGSPQ